jgi:hypothetical protein
MLRKEFLFISLLFSLMIFAACSKDDDSDSLNGQLKLEITDAPSDDANIEGVFVTIAEVRVDGKAVEGFNKTTINLMAYQNGNTHLLFDKGMEAKAYSRISLILDMETDANGGTPGCYVLKTDQTKHKLSGFSGVIDLDYDFEVKGNQETRLVVDFDLRKSIQRSSEGESDYAFVSQTNMQNSVRLVNSSRAGIISGNCTDAVSESDLIIVYAYHKGSFNREVETQGSAQTNLKFHNAVSSAKVNANGNYQLHFLEEGEYELHFASYKRNAQNGRLELQGSLMLDVLSSVNLDAVQVNAASSTTVNVLVTGLLPI